MKIMKEYAVDVDFTMSKTVYVNAENEKEARKKVDEEIRHNPYTLANRFSHYVTHEIIDVYVEE